METAKLEKSPAKRIAGDLVHQQRLDAADIQLANWGRWKVSRESGGSGYGNSSLTCFMKVGDVRDGTTSVPTNDLDAEQCNRLLLAMGQPWYAVAVAKWSAGHSRNEIAKANRMAGATVSRYIEDILRAVAYPAKGVMRGARL